MSEPQPRIRFCVNNPRTLAERNDLLARAYECLGCLGNCDRCFETRFLEIGARFVEGASYEQILDNAQIESAANQSTQKTPRENRGVFKDEQSDDHAGA